MSETTPILAHSWARSENDFYIEPVWVSRRLFEVEEFHGEIWDPACGTGRITTSARSAGFPTHETDIADRGVGSRLDFLTSDREACNIVSNPPFDVAKEFTLKALERATKKVAIVFPTARLNAARWLQQTPLRRVWLLTPRPSMPPGSVILAGGKPGGGKMDFSWIVFEQGYEGRSEIEWLHRDGLTNV